MFLVIDFGSKKTPQIAEVIRSLGFFCEVQKHDEFVSAEGKNLKGIVFSGSPLMLTEIDHQPFHDKYAELVSGKIPVLGICFGHQVLGILHGAKIYRGDQIKRDEEINIL